MVTVEIQITERVTYNKYIEMPKEKYAELNNKLQNFNGPELRQLEEYIGMFCDRQDDYYDAEDLEIEKFRIVNIKTDN